MRTSSLIVRSALAVVALALVSPLSTLAQTFAATTETDAVITSTPPPSVVKVTVPSHAQDKLLYGKVRNGVYTVDGMVAKLQLNYDVDGARFVYMFVPGLGTAVLSLTADPDAITAEASVHENELKFSVGDHRFRLTGIALANNKGRVPEHLYVKLDRAAWQLNRHPMVGFGNAVAMPYQWPGALASAPSPEQAEESQLVPPVPASLLPSPKAVVPVATAPAPVSPVALRPVSMQ